MPLTGSFAYQLPEENSLCMRSRVHAGVIDVKSGAAHSLMGKYDGDNSINAAL